MKVEFKDFPGAFLRCVTENLFESPIAQDRTIAEKSHLFRAVGVLRRSDASLHFIDRY